MRKRLRKWLGIGKLYALFAASSRRIDTLEKQLAEVKALLEAKPEAPKASVKQPIRLKTWAEAKKILEQGEDINAGR